VADAMGFKNIPAINFGIMSLRDEVAEKQLIIQLLDRGVISTEKATEAFGVNYMIELERMKSEQTIRENNPGILEKSNPYNRPFSVMEKQGDIAIELEKVKQQRDIGGGGDSTDDNGGGDNPLGDQPKNDGVTPSGRPPSVKDTAPRDERTPKTLSMLHIVGETLLDQIDKLVDSTYLKQLDVKNMRSLTKAQKDSLEVAKRGILSVLRPGDVVTKELISRRIDTSESVACLLENHFNDLISGHTTSTKQVPNAKERRILTVLAWAMAIPPSGNSQYGTKNV
jgi:hypothetical protein